MNSQIFREYDIRGIVDRDLTDEVMADLGRGFGTLVARDGGSAVVIGRDARLSGPRFRDAFVGGVTSTGVGVIDVGVVPTPVVYHAANTLPVDGLAVITGSHNPADYNGLKAGLGKATFYAEAIQDLRRMIEQRTFAVAPRRGAVLPYDAITPYLHFVTGTVRRGRRKLKVVVDAGNGVGGLTAVPMLEKLGYEVVPLFCEPDGRFPNHHPDPTVPKNLEHLIAAVREHAADVGVAFDGDADRIGVVDELGTIWWGDRLMILLARGLLRDVPGAAIVGEVKCSTTMYADIEAHGGVPIMWKTGHSLIKAKMKEAHALLAGEMSGHIFYRHRAFGYDDGPYAAARLLELVSSQDSAMSALLADVPVTYASPEMRIDVAEDTKFTLVKRCTEALRGRGLTLIEIDGVRVTWPDGFGLIRASNTGPIIVVRYEATTRERMTEIKTILESTIANAQRELGI